MNKKVDLKREDVEIPTYVTYPDEKNPIFYEKRNVQGAAGNIFPLALCDRMEADFRPVPYNVLTLENEYIETTLLPELGGRIYTAQDKSNGYDFVYRNQSIKPQQIGLCGPWISGGIEFNWPQHHRPTTVKAMDWTTEENDDGSKTVWMGEIEPMNRTKGMVGITVYPGKSYLKAKIRLFNRTPFPQTFMWWANLAVAINDKYKAVFPEDLHDCSGHAWARTSKFPILKGMYMGVYDLGEEGLDVRDLQLGGSFFTYNSSYDFLSGYDFGKNAGIVHVADRHISTGKKMFNWGYHEFSEAWWKNLSDEDGPYIELMTGVYSCNQPDFAWIMPYEYKTAEQYWYPIRDIGEVKSANIYGAIGFEIIDRKIKYALNVTEEREDSKIVITCNNKVIYEKTAYIAPDSPFKDELVSPTCKAHELELTIYSSEGKTLVSYRPENYQDSEVPKPLAPSPFADDMNDANDIYIHALHIYQYRHPYFDPMDYLEKGLKINPNHVDSNNLAGKIMMERGDFTKAEVYLKKACDISLQRNPNPYNTEPLYNLGLLQKLQGSYDKAYKNLFKSVWIFAQKSSGYLLLTEIDCIRGDYDLALEHIQESINSNGTNFRAYKLKAMILRRLGKFNDAIECLDFIYKHDKLDFIGLYEKSLVFKAMDCGKYSDAFGEFTKVMRNIPEYYIDIAIDYANAGYYCDAIDILKLGISRLTTAFPVLEYYMAYYQHLNDDDSATKTLKLASNMSIDGCLHSRLDTIAVFEYAISSSPNDAVAPYLLGNMYYGRKTFDKGIENFELSVERRANFPTAYRNLAIGYFDKLDKVEKAGKLIKKAFEMDETDARVFFEYIQYLINTNASCDTRLSLLKKHSSLADGHENIYGKFISTLTESGQYKKAKEMLLNKIFHPYEGGEGIITQEWIKCNLLLGKGLIEQEKFEEAIKVFEDSMIIPPNFNTGRLPIGHPQAHANYHIGIAYEKMNELDKAKEHFKIASVDKSSPEMYYFSGLSLLKLGEVDKAKEMFNGILHFSKTMMENDGKYPYFTKSLVTTLPFEHDTKKNDHALAHYYLGLGYYGLNDKDMAKEQFEIALGMKSSMYMASDFLKGC